MIIFLIWAVSVVATWHIAKQNGRSEGLAVVMGVLFGWIAFVAYLIAGKTFEQKLKEMSAMNKAMKGELN